jgi:hypothetical protein
LSLLVGAFFDVVIVLVIIVRIRGNDTACGRITSSGRERDDSNICIVGRRFDIEQVELRAITYL